MATKKLKMCEIARSFSYKLNCGNYSTADFFCSEKAEVPEIEKEEISEILYEFCKNEVIKSVNKYMAEKLAKETEKNKNKTEYGKPTPQESYNESSQLQDIKLEVNGETDIEKQERQRKEDDARRKALEGEKVEPLLPVIEV